MKLTKANDTSFSTDNQPQNKRGLSTKTLILNAIKKNAFLGLSPNASNAEAEEAFLAHVAQRAVNSSDTSSGMLLKLLSDKAWCNLKPASEKVTFDFDPTLNPSEQAQQVLEVYCQA